MVSGLKTLRKIDKALLKARAQVDASAKLVPRISQNLIEVRRRHVGVIEDIAKVRLSELQTTAAPQTLGYVDRQAAKLMSQHDKRMTQIEVQISKSSGVIETLEAKRRVQESAVETAILAYEKGAQACQKKLIKDPAYIEKLLAVEEAEQKIERAEAKRELAQADVLEKGAPYRDDPFFTYLQKRGFGSKNAKGWALTKWLDGGVSRLINYRTAIMNYERLTAIPARLQTHVETLELYAARARNALSDAEQALLKSEGVEALRKTSLLAQTQLEKTDGKIEQAEDDMRDLRDQQNAMIMGTSGPYLEAVTLLSQTLTRKDVPSLRVLAAQTRSRDDDNAVPLISDLRASGKDLEDDQREAQAVLKSSQATLKQLEKVRRRFKQNRYDAPYSQFPSGGDLIGALIGQVLSGVLSGNDVWRQIERAQRTIGRSTDIDFGGVDWGEAMRLPRSRGGQRSNRSGGSIFGSSTPRSRTRTSRSRAPRIRIPKSRGGGGRGGGFKTGGGF